VIGSETPDTALIETSEMSWFTKAGSIFDIGPRFRVLDKILQSSIPPSLAFTWRAT
jgi:hypothetical protein